MICHPKKYCNMLYNTSWIYFISSVFGIYKEKYDLAIYTGLVWLTSINYWNNPRDPFNYYLDISVVRSGVLYHLLRGVDSPNYIVFYKIFNSGLFFYIPSRYFFNKKQYYISTISHANLHIITGIALIYLYNTEVESLSNSKIIQLIYNNTINL